MFPQEKSDCPTEAQTSSYSPAPLPSPPVILEYRINPGCYDTFMMLPLFFFLGCCSSRTTKIIVKPSLRLVDIVTYPGYMSCLTKKYTVKFTNVLSLEGEFVGHNKYGPLYKLILVTRGKNIELTTAGFIDEIKQESQSVEKFLRQFGIGKARLTTEEMFKRHGVIP